MKKILIVAICIFLLLIACSSVFVLYKIFSQRVQQNKVTSPEYAQHLGYASSYLPFYVEAPPGWYMAQTYGRGNKPRVIFTMVPEENSDQINFPRIEIWFYNKKNRSLSEYVQNTFSNTSTWQGSSESKPPETTVIANQVGYCFSLSNQGLNYDYYFVEHPKVFVLIRGIGKPDTMEILHPAVQSVLDSIKFAIF